MIQSITLLRGVAALLVVIYHACEYTRTHGFPELSNMFRFGAFGVDIFFIISGYVMMLSIEKSKGRHAAHTAIDFFIRRIIRIAPIYWIGTITLYLIYVIQPEKFHQFSATPDQFIRSILFLPIKTSTSTINPILSQGWTLYHELFFYFVLFFLIIVRSKINIKYAAPAAIIIICATLNTLMTETKIEWIELISSPMNMEFAFGCMLFNASNKITNRNNIIIPIALFSIAATIILLNPDQSAHKGFERVIYWGIPATLIFAAAIAKNSTHKYETLFCKYAGDPSYSIYIFHGLAFSATDLVLNKMHLKGELSAGAMIILMTVGATLSGNVINRLIERPLTQKANALWSTWSKTIQ